MDVVRDREAAYSMMILVYGSMAMFANSAARTFGVHVSGYRRVRGTKETFLDEVLEECQWSDHAEQHRKECVDDAEYACESFADVGSCVSMEDICMRKVAADSLEMERSEHVW